MTISKTHGIKSSFTLSMPERKLPRVRWAQGTFSIPPLPDSPAFDIPRLHGAAREASKEWADKVASGGTIDADCFRLAVLDKIIEHILYDRDQRLRGPRRTLETFADWSSWTNKMINRWYWTAYRQLPEGDRAHIPTSRQVYESIRAAVTSLFEKPLDAKEFPAGRPPRYDRSLLGRFDPNCRPLPPVVRYVTPLRFSDGPDPYSEIDAALEAESARRASRRPFNVVKTVMLPPLDVPEMSIDDFLRTRESRSAALGRRTSLSPSLSSSGESDDTVVPPASPASSDAASPEEGRFGL